MQSEKKVLACVDQSAYAQCVADYAAWAARRLQAPLEFLHVMDRHPETATTIDHSGTIGVDAEQRLLDTLSDADEGRSKAAREQGRVFLNTLRERAIAAGVGAPDIRQRQGQLLDALLHQQDQVQLFVLGRRGYSAGHTQRELGRTLEHVVRHLRQPILAVTEHFREPQRVLFAFDGSSTTRAGAELIATSPLFRDLAIDLVMSAKPGHDAKRQLTWAQTTLEAGGLAVQTALLPGDAAQVLTRRVAEQDIDLLIMGAYSHSPLRNLLLGSKTANLLRQARVPALLLR